MRYYNNLNKFEELKSFKRFYSEDPIPGVDVVVEKVPPGNAIVIGINGGDTLPEDIEEAYGVTINTNSLTTSQKKLQRFNLKLDDSTKFSKDEFDSNLTNLAKTINQNAVALSYVMNEISGGVGATGATGSFSFDCDFEHTNCFSGMQLLNVGTVSIGGITFSLSGAFTTSSVGNYFNGIVYNPTSEFGFTHSIISFFESESLGSQYSSFISDFGISLNSVSLNDFSSTQFLSTTDSIGIGRSEGGSEQSFIQIDNDFIHSKLGTSSQSFLVSDSSSSTLLSIDEFGISMDVISQIGGTVGYPDDATAAINGIGLGRIYHDNGILRIRVI